MTWEIWQIFTRALKNLKIWTFMGSFYQKQKMCELKIYRGIMCCDTEECWKIWKEIDLLFKIYVTNLTNFDPSIRKAQKFTLYWAPFDKSL